MGVAESALAGSLSAAVACERTLQGPVSPPVAEGLPGHHQVNTCVCVCVSLQSAEQEQ